MELLHLLAKVGAICVGGGIVLSLPVWIALSWATGHSESKFDEYEE